MLKNTYHRFAEYCDKNVNPVVLKELRQSFNTNGLTWGMVVLLLIMVTITAFMIASARSPENISGNVMFMTFFVIMSLCCCYSIIPMGGYRHNREVFGEQLFNMSGLSPIQLLNGKLTSMLIEVGLIIFLMVPFMAMAYMFQGLLMQVIFQGVFIFVLAVVLLSLFYLCMGSFQVKQMSGLVLACTLIAGPILARYLAGVISYWGYRETPKTILLFDCALLLWTLKYAIFLYTATYTLLCPPSWNRTTPLRLTGTAICLIQGICLIILSHYPPKIVRSEMKDIIRLFTYEWFISFFIFAIIILFCAISFPELTRKSRRRYRSIPKNLTGRLLYFPFFPGEANGIVYSLITAATLIIGAYVIIYNSQGRIPSSLNEIIIFFLIPYFYFMSARVLSMIKLPGTKYQRFVYFLLFLAISINALPIYYCLKDKKNMLWDNQLSYFMSFSYVGLERNSFHQTQIMILCAIIIILAIPCMLSFVESFMKFHQELSRDDNSSLENIDAGNYKF